MAFSPIRGDGFDNYTVGAQRWTIGTGFTCSSTYSRHPFGQGAQIAGRVQIELPPVTSIIMEGAYRHVDSFQAGHYFLSCLKLGVVNYAHCGLIMSESNHVYAHHAQSNTIIGGPTTGPEHVIEAHNWYWFSLKIVLHASAGSLLFKVNGDTWLDVSGVPTSHTGSGGTITDCFQVSEQFGDTFWVDDVVWQDGSTGEFQGDMLVLGKRTDAAGYITQFTPNTGANWAAVDEVAADDDTTYVASDVLGERDSYLLDKIDEVPDSSIVLGVQQAFRHRKDEPGPRSVVAFIRVDTDETPGEERFPSESSYLTSLEEPQTLQPDGVSAWGTVGDFNALDVEIGQEVDDGED